MEDLERYLEEIVEPTIAEFEVNPHSVRHAFLAYVATFHGVDYMAYRRKSSSTVRQEFGQQSQEFALVDRVAHAFKHVVSGHPASPLKPPLKADEIISRPAAHWDTAVWGLSRWSDPVGGLTLDNDRDVDLLDTVKGAAKFLRQQC